MTLFLNSGNRFVIYLLIIESLHFAVLKKAFDAFDQEKQGFIDAAMVST